MFDALVKLIVIIIGVAILAAILSKHAQTSQAITAAGTAFQSLIKTVVTPITGGAS